MATGFKLFGKKSGVVISKTKRFPCVGLTLGYLFRLRGLFSLVCNSLNIHVGWQVVNGCCSWSLHFL